MTLDGSNTADRLPLLSIGVPLFNEQAHVEKSLESLLLQDYPNLEVLLSDNASTDCTVELCRKAAARDTRVVVHTIDWNRGAVWNFRNVLDLAKGRYFMWAGAHDLWEPTFASRCIAALQESPDVVTAFPPAVFIDENDRVLEQVRTAYDTRGIGGLARPWITAWLVSAHYGYPIYGVHRIDEIRQALTAARCIGPDIVTLFALAFLGPTAYVPGPPQISLRKRHDYGDWGAYLTKIYGSRDVKYRQLVQDMRRAYLSVIRQRTKAGGLRMLHWMMLECFMPTIRGWAAAAARAQT